MKRVSSKNFVPRENKKSKARQLQAEWEELLKRHSAPLDRGAKALGLKPKAVNKKPSTPVVIPVETVKSLVTPGGSTALKSPNVYTGDSIIGLSQMHKSNIVPVFRKEDAIDIARMRRN